MSAVRRRHSSSAGSARARAAGLGALLLLVLPVAACGGERDAAVEQVAEDFYAALSQGDGAAACELLAPATRDELEQSAGKPCAAAILEEDVPRVGEARDVDVYGSAGQVDLEGDTAFLGEFRDGWRITAASCTPQPPEPYDCQVAGG